MATEIFKKSLNDLDKIAKHLDSMGKKIDKGLNKPMSNFEKTTKSIEKNSQVLIKSFEKLFSVVKNIGFASLGTGLLSGGALGVRGIQAQKSSVEAKVLGLDTQSKGALEYAGKQTMSDSSFFKDILKNIREASVSDSGFDAFALLGLDALKIRKMPALDALNLVLDSAKSFKGDPTILSNALGELAGIDYQTFQSLDVDKFRKFFEEGLQYTDNSAEKLKGVGESVNRVTQNLQLMADKVLSSLSPAFEKVLNNVSQGLNSIAQNPAFKKMLDNLSEWMQNISKGLDAKVMEIIQSIPEVLRDMQIVFLNILAGLAEASTWILTGEADKKATKFAQVTQKKADLLEAEKYRDQALKAKDEKEFALAWSEGRDLEKKYSIGKESSSFFGKDMQDKLKEVNLQPQINITIQNDPTQAQMQKNFTQSISLGGSNGGNR